MNYETYTLVVNSREDWESPRIIKSRGFRISDSDKTSICLEPKGIMIPATWERGVTTHKFKQVSTTKASLRNRILHIPQAQFGTIVNLNAMILAIDMSQSSFLNIEKLGIGDDSIIAKENSGIYCSWVLFVANDRIRFSIERFVFEIRGGELEEIKN